MISFRERLFLYAFLTSLTSLSIDAVLPGLRQIGAEVSPSAFLSTQHIISIFIFGMAFGELAIGPLSDAMGRKKALILGLCIYLTGTVVAMLANSLELIVLGRFLQGVGVSGPKIATRAMIRDQFDGSAMARIMSFMFTLFILVPMLAPAAAQGLISVAGWRAVFGAYFAIAAILGTWLIMRHPETLDVSARIPLRPRRLAINSWRILSTPRVSLLIIATGLVFGAQLVYLGIAADLFFDAYQIDRGFPLLFAMLASGVGLASYINARLVGHIGMEVMARSGFIALSTSGGLFLWACLTWGDGLPLPVLMILLFGAFFAIGILFGNLNAMAMRPLGDVAGLGASLIASGSSLVATLFAVALGHLYNGNALPLAIGFLTSGILALGLSELALRANPSPIEALR